MASCYECEQNLHALLHSTQRFTSVFPPIITECLLWQSISYTPLSLLLQHILGIIRDLLSTEPRFVNGILGGINLTPHSPCRGTFLQNRLWPLSLRSFLLGRISIINDV